MKYPRWRILIPVAILITILTPALRSLPAGLAIPDPWLLFTLMALPLFHGDRIGYGVRFVALLGILRASVSAASVFSCWAGLGAALIVRERVHRRFTDEHFMLRFGIGLLSSLPPTLLDALDAQRLGLQIPWNSFAWRILWVGLIWATIKRPGPSHLHRQV
ncbi:MAG: hypothetical protein HQ519_05270 [Planctomycetes bacterium]|nr:hypothetical protein [Planctomycetota bacterium]